MTATSAPLASTVPPQVIPLNSFIQSSNHQQVSPPRSALDPVMWGNTAASGDLPPPPPARTVQQAIEVIMNE